MTTRRLASTVALLGALAPTPALAGYGHRPYGEVVVDNRAGGPVTVSVAGPPVAVRAGSRATFWVPAGQVVVHASYAQLGVAGSLADSSVWVAPGRPAFVTLPPAIGTVAVTNPWPVAMVVHADQITRSIGPNETMTLDLPVGPVALSADLVDGRTVDVDRGMVTWGGRTEWRIDAPSTGELRVDSRLGLPARVMVDGTVVAGLAPYQDQSLQVANGWHRVTAVDVHGRLVESTWVEVRPFEVAEAEIAPIRGDRDGDGDGDRDHGWYGDRGDRDGHDADRDGADRADRDGDDRADRGSTADREDRRGTDDDGYRSDGR